MSAWHLECSACDHQAGGLELASVCPKCGQPYLVTYDSPWPKRSAILDRWDMWRYSAVLPLAPGEAPVPLGEGGTPLLELPRLHSVVTDEHDRLGHGPSHPRCPHPMR